MGAGLPYSVPAYTVGMVCGSGMKSVIEAGRAILAGDADIIVCGGTENMSAAPYASTDARWGARMGDKKLVDTMIKDGLWDAFNNYHIDVYKRQAFRRMAVVVLPLPLGPVRQTSGFLLLFIRMLAAAALILS